MALVFAPLPFAQADVPVEPRIIGTVTAGGEPVDEINVAAYDEQGEYVANRWTGDDGKYELSVPPNQSYRLEFMDSERQNFRTEYWNDQPTLAAATPIAVGANDVTGTNADLTRNPTIRGTVTTENLDEIEGARIEVFRLDGGSYDKQAGVFYSGVDGRYRAPVEAGGTYKLKIVNAGYATEWFDDAETEAGAEAISMTTANMTGADVRLAASPAITGVVNGPSGPAAQVIVTAYRLSFGTWWHERSASTNANGSYVLRLEPGEYRLGFSHQSYLTEYYNDSLTKEGSTPVVLGAGGLTANATLAAPGTIHGTVRADVGDAGLAGITVAAERWTEERFGSYWQPLGEATTGTDGSYAVPAAPGTYRLRFDGGSAYRSEYHADVTDPALATSVIVGSAGVAVDASLTHNPTVSGVVTKPGGAGLADIKVSLLAEVTNWSGTSWKAVATGRTAADGSYAVDAPLGDYRLRFRDDKNGVYRTEYYADSPTSTGATLLQLTAGGLAGKDAELIPQAAVSGTVTGPVGAAAGVTVTAYELYEDDGIDMVAVAASTTTSATGAYSLALEDGTYRLKFSTSDLSLRPEFWDDASSFGEAQEIVVDGSAVTGKDAELEVGSGITGTVSVPDGYGWGTVLVYSRDADGSWHFFDEVYKTSGTFDVSLPPGTYRLKYEAGWFDPIYGGGSATFGGSTEFVITPGVVQHVGDVTFGGSSAVTNAVAPSVVGTSVVGSSLRAEDGTWGPEAVELSRQWLRDGQPIQGATASTYSLVPDDFGARIAVQVKGAREGLLSRSKTSAPTGRVAVAPVQPAPPVVGPPAPVVKKAASISVSAKGAKKKATLTITVKASGVTPTGKVTIKLGGKTLKNVTLKNGKAKVTLAKQKKGKRTYKVIYAGDSRVNAKTVNSKKVTIK